MQKQTPQVRVRRQGDPPDDRRMRTDQEPAQPPTQDEPFDSTAYNKMLDYERQIRDLKDQVSSLIIAQAETHNAKSHQRDIIDPRTMQRAELESAIQAAPKYSEFSPEVQRHILDVALLTGLHPIFEMHAFPGNKGELIITPDYKALQRRARDRYAHLSFGERQLSPDEMRQRGVPEQDIKEGSIMVEVTITNLIDAMIAKMADVPYSPYRGVAWAAAKKDEVKWDARQRKKVRTGKRIAADVPNTRDLYFRAWTRAMRAACYQVADLSVQFNNISGGRVEHGDEFVFDIEQQISDAAHEALVDGADTLDHTDAEPEPDESNEGESSAAVNTPWSWQAHIAGWERAHWLDYWDKMSRYNLTGSDVHTALGVTSVKDFKGTETEHNTLINQAVTAKREGRPISPPAQSDQDKPSYLDLSGAEGTIIISRAVVEGRSGKKPILTIYGIAPNGEEDQLPAITGEYDTATVREWFPATPSPLPQDAVEVLNAEDTGATMSFANWQLIEGEPVAVAVRHDTP